MSVTITALIPARQKDLLSDKVMSGMSASGAANMFKARSMRMNRLLRRIDEAGRADIFNYKILLFC